MGLEQAGVLASIRSLLTRALQSVGGLEFQLFLSVRCGVTLWAPVRMKGTTTGRFALLES